VNSLVLGCENALRIWLSLNTVDDCMFLFMCFSGYLVFVFKNLVNFNEDSIQNARRRSVMRNEWRMMLRRGIWWLTVDLDRR